jgi:type IV pilus assembly protein PilP
MESVLKKRHYIFCAVIIGSLSVTPGCSDFTDKYGDLLPGFLKSKEKKEEPVVHKLKPTEEIRGTAPGTMFTPSAVAPVGGEEGLPGKPGPGGPIFSDKGATKGTPALPEKQPPGTETAKKPGEKTTPPVVPDKSGKPAVPPKTGTTEKTGDKTPPAAPEKTGGDKAMVGEDIAMLALTPGGGGPTMAPTKPVDSLMDKEYTYDPTGKRDPFRPFNLKVEKKTEVPPEELTPLQRYNLSQLKLTAIIYDSEKGTGIAMVEAPDKKGYNVIVGSEIGGGKVVRINETDVQVEMSYEDFYGNTEKRIETLKIAGGR